MTLRNIEKSKIDYENIYPIKMKIINTDNFYYYGFKGKNYKITNKEYEILTNFQRALTNNENDPITKEYSKQHRKFMEKITEMKLKKLNALYGKYSFSISEKLHFSFKKNPNYTNYKFSIKYPIDYRYLSFNHKTILKVIFKIKYNKISDKINETLNNFKIDLHIANIKICELLKCRELKKQDQEIAEKSRIYNNKLKISRAKLQGIYSLDYLNLHRYSSHGEF